MRFGGIGERTSFFDPKFQLVRCDGIEQLARALQQFAAIEGVMRETWTRQEQRAFGRQLRRIEGGDGSARLTVEDEIPARSQTIETLVKRGLPDGIIDDVNTPVLSQSFHFRSEVGLRVEDDVICAVVLRESRFVLRRYGAADNPA